MTDPRQFLLDLFSVAVDAVSAARCLPAHLPPAPANGRIVVVGAGKGAAAMARVVEQHYSGKVSGMVVTRYEHGCDCEHIEVIEASHPVPDDAGQRAAKRMLDMVSGLSAD